MLLVILQETFGGIADIEMVKQKTFAGVDYDQYMRRKSQSGLRSNNGSPNPVKINMHDVIHEESDKDLENNSEHQGPDAHETNDLSAGNLL